MKKMLLVGGGEVGRGRTAYETKEIDIEAVKMTEKKNPNFLFIGLASSFSDSYYDTMKKIYKDLGCSCAYLKKKNIINNPQIVKDKIKEADLIYIGGGDTIKLLNDIKEYGIDVLLREAYENGTVLLGISAGAILLSSGGFSDSLILRGESDEYTFVEGLHFINIEISPHYKASIEKDNSLKEYLKKVKKDFFCLENCTALKIIDNTYQVIKSSTEKEVYLCSVKDNQLKEQKLTSGVIPRK